MCNCIESIDLDVHEMKILKCVVRKGHESVKQERDRQVQTAAVVLNMELKDHG
jgi:hypothetical protein